MSRSLGLVSLALLLVASSANAATLQVGPGKGFARPCDANAAAKDGDVIEIDASGDYHGDVCQWSQNGLTLRGVGGRPKIDATGVTIPNGKGIWVFYGDTTTVENIEFSGASVPDQNGAGIRHQGLNLTVRDCYFHDNQDGILGAPLAGGKPADGQGEVLIERSEFAHNGAGDGYSHNMYLNHYAKLTLRYSYSHDCAEGHLVKTRAAENYILYNRITGEGGTQSYEIDVPNGGKTYIVGNLVQQSATTHNPAIITYEEEGTNAQNPTLALFVVNNTIVNDLGKGTFVHVGKDVTAPVVFQNNILVGAGTDIDQASAVKTANFTGDPKLVDQAGFDYHLTAGSPCVDTGTAPGMGDGFALTPDHVYVHPAGAAPRPVVGAIDVGAYELGGGGGAGGGGHGGGSSSSSSSGNATGSQGGGGAGGSGEGGQEAGSKGGCGCRVGEGSRAGGAAAIALSLLLAMRRRRGSRLTPAQPGLTKPA